MMIEAEDEKGSRKDLTNAICNLPALFNEAIHCVSGSITGLTNRGNAIIDDGCPTQPQLEPHNHHQPVNQNVFYPSEQ